MVSTCTQTMTRHGRYAVIRSAVRTTVYQASLIEIPGKSVFLEPTHFLLQFQLPDVENDRNTIQYAVKVGSFVQGTEKIQQIFFRNQNELNTSHGLV